MSYRIENFKRNKKTDNAHRQYQMDIVITRKTSRWHRYVDNVAVYEPSLIENRYQLVIEAKGGAHIQWFITDPDLGLIMRQTWITANEQYRSWNYRHIGDGLRDAIRRLLIRVGSSV